MEPEPAEGGDTFIFIMRNGDVRAFDRFRQPDNVSAEQLAAWFLLEKEGQDALGKMIASLDTDLRRSDELQKRGELVRLPTSPTFH